MMESILGDTFGKENEGDDFIARFQVGSLFDHVSGQYVRGSQGEMILNAGTPYTTAIVGENNQYKSTVMDFMQLTNFDWYYKQSNYLGYESEGSKDKSSLLSRSSRMPTVMEHGIYNDPRIFLTNMLKMSANDYWDYRNKVGELKRKNMKKLMIETPMLTGDGKGLISILAPTFESMDSFTRLEFDKIEGKYDGNELGSKDNNMYHIDTGRVKDLMIKQMPGKNGRMGFYTFMTAHIGEKLGLDPMTPPAKIMAHLQQGKTLKGVPESFRFLTNNMWFCHHQKPCQGSDKLPLYGRGEMGDKDDKDLVEVIILNLRGKKGQSGSPLSYIFSQAEGHLPHLTQLNYIRATKKYFGMDSNTQNISLDLYPDVKMSRNKVRPTIDEDPMMRRAIEITADLAQIQAYHWYLGNKVFISPLELFERIKEKRYDWDEILGNTHSRWSFVGQERPTHFLSTLDLINMAAGEYTPFWKSRVL